MNNIPVSDTCDSIIYNLNSPIKLPVFMDHSVRLKRHLYTITFYGKAVISTLTKQQPQSFQVIHIFSCHTLGQQTDL